MAHMVKCVKMGREIEGFAEPPFDGPLGQRIYETSPSWRGSSGRST